MSFIVISDPECFDREADLINALFEQGMPRFHLRKPGMDKKGYAGLISMIDPVFHARIALHQFHELLQDYPLIRRLHYPEKLRNESHGYHNKYTLSTSIHHLKDLEQLSSFDYSFYGPVFHSLSKPGYQGLSSTALKLPPANNRIKLIALGGITAKNVWEIKRMGFDGMAVLGSIWADKKQAIHNFKQLINKYNESFT